MKTSKLGLLGVWDSGVGFDRYIVIFTCSQGGREVYNMSDNADSPQGCCIYRGDKISDKYLATCTPLGVSIHTIPVGVQRQIDRLCEYFNSQGE